MLTRFHGTGSIGDLLGLGVQAILRTQQPRGVVQAAAQIKRQRIIDAQCTLAVINILRTQRQAAALDAILCTEGILVENSGSVQGDLQCPWISPALLSITD